ncbi:hypothetical protein HDU96_006430 [Phlyctochytrium bullatum]|nr:hypothetical protein HDU96_006430 [Phlyctochytrium bullatum]
MSRLEPHVALKPKGSISLVLAVVVGESVAGSVMETAEVVRALDDELVVRRVEVGIGNVDDDSVAVGSWEKGEAEEGGTTRAVEVATIISGDVSCAATPAIKDAANANAATNDDDDGDGIAEK